MKRLGLLALMLAGIAPAQAVDYVLVYYPKGNVTYTCKLLPSYIDTEGRTRLDFNQCDVFSTDLNDYGPFPFMPVKLTMSGPALLVCGAGKWGGRYVTRSRLPLGYADVGY